MLRYRRARLGRRASVSARVPETPAWTRTKNKPRLGVLLCATRGTLPSGATRCCSWDEATRGAARSAPTSVSSPDVQPADVRGGLAEADYLTYLRHTRSAGRQWGGTRVASIRAIDMPLPCPHRWRSEAAADRAPGAGSCSPRAPANGPAFSPFFGPEQGRVHRARATWRCQSIDEGLSMYFKRYDSGHSSLPAARTDPTRPVPTKGAP